MQRKSLPHQYLLRAGARPAAILMPMLLIGAAVFALDSVPRDSNRLRPEQESRRPAQQPLIETPESGAKTRRGAKLGEGYSQDAQTTFAQGLGLTPVPAEVDLGLVPTNTRISYTAIFVNTGGTPVKIEDTRSSCGCTVASTRNAVFEPGAIAGVDVAIHVNARPREGVTRTIRFITDGGDVVTLALRYSSTDAVILEPRERRECGIRLRTGEQLTIVDAGPPHLLSVEARDGPSDSHTLLLSDQAVSQLKETARIVYRDRHGEVTTLNVPMAALMRGVRPQETTASPQLLSTAESIIQIQPRRINVGRIVQPDEPVILRLSLEVPSVPSTVSVETDSPEIAANLQSVTLLDDGSIEAEVAIDASRAGGRFADRLLIHTEFGSAAVRIRGLVRHPR